jgi:EmrB/QacA subfamily drug resistance transporter
MNTLSTINDGNRPARSFQQSLLAMLGMALAAVLVALDQTIVGTALPQIVRDLKAFDLYAWVATSYMLTSIIAIPVFGRLGDLFGRKPLLLTAILLFTVASLLCGIADSMLHLVIARGIQGLGGGIVMGTIFATVADLFPEPASRLRWQVVVTAALGAGNIAGPILAGVLTQYCNWRLVFFVNLPIGAAALLFIHRFLPDVRHSWRRPRLSRMDWFGACVLILSLAALLLLIELLPREGLTELTVPLAAIIATGALTLWFWEQRTVYPIIPIAMLVDHRLGAIFIMSVLAGFGSFALLFNVPLLFQGGFGMSAAHSGMLITPLILGATVTQLKRANLTLCVGFALFIVACLSVVAITGKMPHLVWMACMGAGGVGLGIVGSGLSIFSQQIVARAHLGAATAVLQSLRTLGGMLGIATTCSLLSHLYTRGVHDSLRSYQAMQWFKSFASPAITVDRSGQANLVNQLVFAGHAGDAIMGSARQALVGAIHAGLAVAAGAALIGLCVTWFALPERTGHPGVK